MKTKTETIMNITDLIVELLKEGRRVELPGIGTFDSEVQSPRHDPQTQVLYSLMVDRFCNGNAGNDAPLNRPDVDPRADYKGGDLKGITGKIEDGFFDTLGVNSPWEEEPACLLQVLRLFLGERVFPLSGSWPVFRRLVSLLFLLPFKFTSI